MHCIQCLRKTEYTATPSNIFVVQELLNFFFFFFHVSAASWVELATNLRGDRFSELGGGNCGYVEDRWGGFSIFTFCIFGSGRQLLYKLYASLLVHGHVTIIFVVSVCLSVSLFVCLFVQIFLSRLRSDLDQIRTHVTCPGLVVSRTI